VMSKKLLRDVDVVRTASRLHGGSLSRPSQSSTPLMKSLKIVALDGLLTFIHHYISNPLNILITWISIFTQPYLDHDHQHCGSGDVGGSDAKVGIREREEGEQSSRRELRRGPLLTDSLSQFKIGIRQDGSRQKWRPQPRQVNITSNLV